MKASLIIRLAATALPLLALQAQAADFSFSGHSTYNTDIVQVRFTLDQDATQVNLWTDSWQSGLNFDPTLTLWAKQGADYVKVAENDDDATVHAGQGFYDSGLALQNLTAGQYLVTLGAAPNYANGSLLSGGFAFDGSTPIQIAQWDQPSYDINANDQKGTFWRLQLSGVDAASAVPEPSSLALLLAGAGVWMSLPRRRA
jgi:hypothetical protein